MKALLDAQLSFHIADLLQRKRLDVEAITSRNDIPDNTPDARVLEIGAAEARAVVTNNIRDFRPLATERLRSGQDHAGLILVPSSRPRTKAAVQALADDIERVLVDNPGGLANSERWI